MGAWGVLAFDNDDANDWAYELDNVTDLSLVESAFETVESADDYLEAPEASNALAACEVLARLKGHPGYTNVYTEKVDEWVKQNPQTPSPELIARGHAVIDRVLGEDSELLELWSEGDPSEWLAAVEDLRRRMNA
jgi:hypothetical protein